MKRPVKSEPVRSLIDAEGIQLRCARDVIEGVMVKGGVANFNEGM